MASRRWWRFSLPDVLLVGRFCAMEHFTKYNRVGMIAPFNFLIPVSGAALSAIFLGENILEWKYRLRWCWCVRGFVA